MPAPAAAETFKVPQATVPSIVLVPFTVSVQVPGHTTEPRSQCLAAVPLIAIWPLAEEGAQINRFQHARSPTGHQAEPAQAAESPAGACEHGAANQVKPPPLESAAALGGQAEIEHGVDPNEHVPTHSAPPPARHVPVEKPAWLTNSRVTSRARSWAPSRQIPPPPGNPEPLK